MNETLAVMLLFWHMLLRLYASICLKSQSSLMDHLGQQKSVPILLLALVNMVLEGPSIKDQIQECSTQAALSIAQLLKFNSVGRKQTPHLSNTAFPKKHLLLPMLG